MSTEISIKAGNKYLVKQTKSFEESRKWNTPLPPSIWYCIRETKTCWQMSYNNPRVYTIGENDGQYIEKTEIYNTFIFLEDLGDYNKTN
jgi:hypothetical protein